MGICDSSYRFIYVDVGQSGGGNDAGIWDLTPLCIAFEQGKHSVNYDISLPQVELVWSCYISLKRFFNIVGKVNIPPPSILPNDSSNITFPYTLVGDEAFPLRAFMMRPFPGRALDSETKRVYNYRLSRARRVIENSFGKLMFFYSVSVRLKMLPQ